MASTAVCVVAIGCALLLLHTQRHALPTVALCLRGRAIFVKFADPTHCKRHHVAMLQHSPAGAW